MTVQLSFCASTHSFIQLTFLMIGPSALGSVRDSGGVWDDQDRAPILREPKVWLWKQTPKQIMTKQQMLWMKCQVHDHAIVQSVGQHSPPWGEKQEQSCIHGAVGGWPQRGIQGQRHRRPGEALPGSTQGQGACSGRHSRRPRSWGSILGTMGAMSGHPGAGTLGHAF